MRPSFLVYLVAILNKLSMDSPCLRLLDHFILAEFSKATYPAGRHPLFRDPFKDRFPLDPGIDRDFVHRDPSIFHH
jgi:hypothetical protein